MCGTISRWPPRPAKKAMEKKMKQTIREILGKHGGLPDPVDTLADDADLYSPWNQVDSFRIGR